MDDYTAAADKLSRELTHLDRAMEAVEEAPSQDHIDLALANAKRVRSASTLLVRALARFRDNKLQPKEGTSNNG